MSNVLAVENLHIRLKAEKGFLPVVNGVDFSLQKGKVLGNVMHIT